MSYAELSHIQHLLLRVGIAPTQQRLALGDILLSHHVHMTAEQVLEAVQQRKLAISRATVYNTLKLFVQEGLLKELVVDGSEAVYDSNVHPHHHLYDVDTGRVSDLPLDMLQVQGLEGLAGALDIDGVDVVIRARRKPAGQAA